MPGKLRAIRMKTMLNNRQIEKLQSADSVRGFFWFCFFSFSTAATAEDAGV